MAGAFPRLLAAVAAVLLAGCPGRRYDFPPMPVPGPLYTRPVAERTIPSGGMVWLRTLEAILSEEALPDRSFNALIVRDVLDPAGNVLIPSGSQARLIVIAGADGRLALGLYSVRVFGNTYTLVPGDTSLPANTASRAAQGSGELAMGVPLGVLVDGKIGRGAAAMDRASLLVEGPALQVPDNTLLLYRLLRPSVIQ